MADSLFPIKQTEVHQPKAKARSKKSLPSPTVSEESNGEGLKSWALVELMGHQKIVGWMTVNPPEFPNLIRVDVPDLIKDGKVIRPGLTRYVSANALYGVTPIDEETVKRMLPMVSGAPGDARPYSLREDY